LIRGRGKICVKIICKMWRDILLILGFALATLTYFGITPRKISGYTKVTSTEIGKRSVYQRIWLLVQIILTIAYIVVGVFIFTRPLLLELRLAFIIMLAFVIVASWVFMLTDVWKLSEKWKRAMDRIMLYGGIFTTLTLWTITMFLGGPVWKKVVYPIVGIGIGFGLGRLLSYLVTYIEKMLDKIIERMGTK
jgi:cation transport ATPase